MPLSTFEETMLVSTYDDLQDFLTPDKKEVWILTKEEIIAFCKENEIFLYNIGSLKQSNASELLNQLVDHFSLPLELLDKSGREQLINLRLLWKKEFEETLEKEQEVLVNFHNDAYLSIIDQYQKTKKILPETLLSFKDIVDLFTLTKPPIENVVAFEPFSLTEHSVEQKEKLLTWIQLNSSLYDRLFVPVNHDGHWFYLLYQEGVWRIKDSQPLLQNGAYSPRQQSIIENCNNLFIAVNEAIKFETSSEQNNDFDCGSRVINAYGALANPSYLTKSHRKILLELFQCQKPAELSDFAYGENIFKQQNNDERLNDVESILSDEKDDEFFEQEENFSENDINLNDYPDNEFGLFYALDVMSDTNNLSPEVEQITLVFDMIKTVDTPDKLHEERLSFINRKLIPINTALSHLEEKISKINHHYTKAKISAQGLLSSLKECRDSYRNSLLVGETSQLDEAAEALFKSSCKEKIDAAVPVLSKDLGWGLYLKNLLKELVNTAITTISLGKYQGTIFKINRGESLTAVEEAEDSLSLRAMES